MICTFFGHRDTPQEIQPKLEKILIDLIESQNANTFYVGNHGAFDRIVKSALKTLQLQYPQIKYAVVLAYLPSERKERNTTDYTETVYPDFESTPPKYAIDKRNCWMIEKSDTVITYVTHTFGGAAKFKELAEKKGKKVINL